MKLSRLATCAALALFGLGAVGAAAQDSTQYWIRRDAERSAEEEHAATVYMAKRCRELAPDSWCRSHNDAPKGYGKPQSPPPSASEVEAETRSQWLAECRKNDTEKVCLNDYRRVQEIQSRPGYGAATEFFHAFGGYDPWGY